MRNVMARVACKQRYPSTQDGRLFTKWYTAHVQMSLQARSKITAQVTRMRKDRCRSLRMQAAIFGVRDRPP